MSNIDRAILIYYTLLIISAISVGYDAYQLSKWN